MRKRSSFFYVLCVGLLLLTSNAFGQKNALKDADQDFKNLRYFDAIELYKKAYTDLGESTKNGVKTTKARILFQIAECYRMIGDAKQEEQWYKKSVKAAYPDDVDVLYLADAQREQGNYDDALTNYKIYVDKVPSDKRGTQGVTSCEQATKWKTTPTRYVVTDMVQINAKERDYSPCYADKRYDELYFVSNRPGGTGDKPDINLGEGFADIYDTKADKNGKWSTAVPIAAPVNTADNEGPMCFTHDFKTLYFTRCQVTKNKGVKCQIWSSVRKGNTWEDPVMIPFQNDSTTYAYPTLSKDDQEMIFSSDMAGGQGKMDLYVSHFDKKNKQWGTPINLGPDINTAGNDMFPFLHENGDLYFSTDGLPGFGGLDIFKCIAIPNQTDKWNKPENMQYPVNSEADDFGIIFEGTKERGYFSSNRTGGKGKDDIYSFNLPPLLFAASGTVRDKKTNKPIVGAIVNVVGSNGSVTAVKTDTGGHYFLGAKGTDRYLTSPNSYILSADAKDQLYLVSQVKENLSTAGVTESKTWVYDFVLEKAGIGMRFPKVEYILDHADLLPQSKDSLNYLVKLLKDNPTISIELDAHTDPRGSIPHNMKLSQMRAQSCVDYLITQGIDSARLAAKGWGPNVPVPGCSAADIAKMKSQDLKEAAWQADRRTEFRVLTFNYVPKGYKMTHMDSLKMESLKDAKVSGQGAAVDSSALNGGNAPQPTPAPQPNNTPAPKPKGPAAPAANEGVIIKKN